MTQREDKIEMIMKNMGYIRLGLQPVIDESSERGDRECAAWLLGTIEALVEDVERKHRQQAIEARKRLTKHTQPVSYTHLTLPTILLV